MRHLRRIHITDSPTACPGAADVPVCDVVVWLGAEEPPTALAESLLVVQPSSLHAAAVYVAGGPAKISLGLSEPLEFMRLLADVTAAPALCAA